MASGLSCRRVGRRDKSELEGQVKKKSPKPVWFSKDCEAGLRRFARVELPRLLPGSELKADRDRICTRVHLTGLF